MLYGAEVAVYSEINTEHIKYSVGRKYSYWMLNLLVHHIGFKRLMLSQRDILLMIDFSGKLSEM